jgi:hypothetical protein
LIGAEQGIAGEIVGIIWREVDGEIEGFLAVLRSGREHLLAFRDIAAVIARQAFRG